MTIFREDTSFPFLKIAREQGVPYARVLRIADAIESQRTYLIDPKDIPLDRLVGDAVGRERARRAAVSK